MRCFNKYPRVALVYGADRRAQNDLRRVEDNLDTMTATGRVWRADDPWAGRYAAALAQLKEDD